MIPNVKSLNFQIKKQITTKINFSELLLFEIYFYFISVFKY